MTPSPFELRDGRRLGFDRALVMGVVNVTPDSFSDGGRWLEASAAIAHGVALAEAGAAILDVGGESTRPGSDPVPDEVQLARVLPVVRGLAERGLVVSVDTTSAAVAREAIAAGAEIINDISAFRFDPAMVEVLVETGVPAFAMHTRGAPKTMQRDVHYDDVVAEVTAHLAERVAFAVQRGVRPSQLGVDPGLGFGKRLEDNLALLRGLDAVLALGHPVLVGPSRKAFIGAITGRAVGERLMGTAAAVAVSIAAGANVVRVHDVAALKDVVLVADAIARGMPSPA